MANLKQPSWPGNNRGIPELEWDLFRSIKDGNLLDRAELGCVAGA